MAELTNGILHTHTAEDPTSHEVADPPTSYTYYHAGPLFSLGDLHANVLLSHAIRTHSQDKFIPILPQDLEQRDTTPHSIRDQDIRALLSCDLALFTYDGSELDSGTVVEYMVAKIADIPAVILRTDFRGGGDQGKAGDPWNLMSSFWPRTKGVVVDGMLEYKIGLSRALKEEGSGKIAKGGCSQRAGELLVDMTAAKVVEALEKVTKLPSKMPKELRECVYQWIALMTGFKSGGEEGNIKEMLELLKKKETRGLL